MLAGKVRALTRRPFQRQLRRHPGRRRRRFASSLDPEFRSRSRRHHHRPHHHANPARRPPRRRRHRRIAERLLTPDLLRRLEQFQLLAARRAKSSAKGERRSKARGQSVEFADYRNYVAGDDFRYLDWNLYGRLERLFLKLYEEERELPVRIFLDASESMTFGTPPKFDFARQVAAAVGYVALCGFDRVTVYPFPDLDLQQSELDRQTLSNEAAARGGLRAVRGRKSSMQFFQNITALTARGTLRLQRVASSRRACSKTSRRRRCAERLP